MTFSGDKVTFSGDKVSFSGENDIQCRNRCNIRKHTSKNNVLKNDLEESYDDISAN